MQPYTRKAQVDNDLFSNLGEYASDMFVRTSALHAKAAEVMQIKFFTCATILILLISK